MWVVKHSNRGKEEALSNHPNLLALGFAAQAGNKGDWYRAMQRVGRSGGVQGYRAVTAELSDLSYIPAELGPSSGHLCCCLKEEQTLRAL